MCPKPECPDYSTDCSDSSCDTNADKLWCAGACKSCHLRDKCFNALGDEVCEQEKHLCKAASYFGQLCKKTCTNCDKVTPPEPPCKDLTIDCNPSKCNNDYGKVWCAATCNSCALREKCFNAAGDAKCPTTKNYMCKLKGVHWDVVCKKSCTGCEEKPVCKDLTIDCKYTKCSTDHQKVWCAQTCNQCAMRELCYNADGDDECARMVKLGMCKTAFGISHTCKKACKLCTETEENKHRAEDSWSVV